MMLEPGSALGDVVVSLVVDGPDPGRKAVRSLTASRAVIAFASNPLRARFERWPADSAAVEMGLQSENDADTLEDCLRLCTAICESPFPGSNFPGIVAWVIGKLEAGRVAGINHLLRMMIVGERAGLDRLVAAIEAALSSDLYDEADTEVGFRYDVIAELDAETAIVLFQNAGATPEPNRVVMDVAVQALRESRNWDRTVGDAALLRRVPFSMLIELVSEVGDYSFYRFTDDITEDLLAPVTAWVNAQNGAGTGQQPLLSMSLDCQQTPELSSACAELVNRMPWEEMSETYRFEILPRLPWFTRAASHLRLAEIIRGPTAKRATQKAMKGMSVGQEHVVTDGSWYMCARLNAPALRAAVEANGARSLSTDSTGDYPGQGLHISCDIDVDREPGMEPRLYARIRMTTPFVDVPDNVPLRTLFKFALRGAAAHYEFVTVSGQAPEARVALPEDWTSIALAEERTIDIDIENYRVVHSSPA